MERIGRKACLHALTAQDIRQILMPLAKGGPLFQPAHLLRVGSKEGCTGGQGGTFHVVLHSLQSRLQQLVVLQGLIHGRTVCYDVDLFGGGITLQ